MSMGHETPTANGITMSLPPQRIMSNELQCRQHVQYMTALYVIAVERPYLSLEASPQGLWTMIYGDEDVI